MWNFDKTNFRLNIARNDWMLVLSELINEHKQQDFSKCSDNRESMTNIECINDTRFSISSFLIMMKIMIMNSWINNDLNDEMILFTADTNYFNDWLFLEWLKQFDKHFAKTQRETYRLLLMNEYESHHTCEFIEYDYQVKIISIDLSIHITHFL